MRLLNFAQFGVSRPNSSVRKTGAAIIYSLISPRMLLFCIIEVVTFRKVMCLIGRQGWKQMSKYSFFLTGPPIFTEFPLPVLEALAGTHLSFSCVAIGNPTPTITWLKDGTVIQNIHYQVRVSAQKYNWNIQLWPRLCCRCQQWTVADDQN